MRRTPALLHIHPLARTVTTQRGFPRYKYAGPYTSCPTRFPTHRGSTDMPTWVRSGLTECTTTTLHVWRHWVPCTPQSPWRTTTCTVQMLSCLTESLRPERSNVCLAHRTRKESRGNSRRTLDGLPNQETPLPHAHGHGHSAPRHAPSNRPDLDAVVAMYMHT